MSDRPTQEETIALLKATLESTHDAILVVDLDRRIIFYNRRYLQMFGFTAGELDRGGLDLVLERLGHELEDEDTGNQTLRELSANARRNASTSCGSRTGASTKAMSRRTGSDRARSGAWRASATSDRRSARPKRSSTIARSSSRRRRSRTSAAGSPSWTAPIGSGGPRNHTASLACRSGKFEGTSDAFYAFLHPDDRETRSGRRAARPSPTASRTISSIASCVRTARSAGCTSRRTSSATLRDARGG